MLASEYHNIGQKPVDLDVLEATKVVRNFLCDYLYYDKLLLSYAPAGEFGSAQAYRWLTGGHICDYDGTGDTIAPREKINYRVIRMLFDAGLIKVKTNIRTPHTRCVIFEWVRDIKKYRREILRTKIFGENVYLTSAMIDATAAQYGLTVTFVGARGVFEILDGNGNSIQNGKAKNTYIFMNSVGEPVGRLRDMSYWEWEQYLYDTATRAKLRKTPLKVRDGMRSHFSEFKRA